MRGICVLGVTEFAKAGSGIVEGISICDPVDNSDFNANGTVDLDDYAAFSECMSQPYQDPHPAAPECISACLSAFDFDGDDDVALMGFAVFAGRL